MSTASAFPNAEDFRGLFRYFFEAPGGLEIECWLEYEAEQAATDIDPHYAATTTLVFALVNGCDIENLLRPDVVAAIERIAVEYREHEAEEAKAVATDLNLLE